jgi:hypothetical protein
MLCASDFTLASNRSPRDAPFGNRSNRRFETSIVDRCQLTKSVVRFYGYVHMILAILELEAVDSCQHRAAD